MTRPKAKKIAERNGIQLGKWWNFASINDKKDVWWIDIPIAKVAMQRVILLHDPRIKDTYLHILDIPGGFLSEKLGEFKIRDSKKIALELSIDKRNMFQDKRPKSGNVPFACFLRQGGAE